MRLCIGNKHLRLALFMAFAALSVALPLAAYAAVQVDGDFSLELKVNGEEISDVETIVIDPEQDLSIDIRIFNVVREVTLESVSAVVTFAGQRIATVSEDLGGFSVAAGEEYRESITVSPREALKVGNITLVTGIYRASLDLHYTVAGQASTWSESKKVKIPGNPVTTPVGAATVAVSGGAAIAGLALARSLVTPGLAVGASVPASTSVTPFQSLLDLALERLEPTARGRVVGNITKAAKGRIVKDRCPICGARLKRGHCYTCKKSGKEVQNEYAEKVKALALEGARLLVSGEAKTLDALCSRLGIDDRLGTDVIATLKNAKLIKVRGIARKLMGKAMVTGIGSGISAVLWVTVGGFAALSTAVLIAILAASVVVPIAVVKGLQMRARRALKRVS